MAEALKKVSDLFTKIAGAKNEVAKAKAQHNRVQATPAARQTTHLPRVEAPLPRVADPLEADCRIVPRVANGPQEDCRVVEDVPTPSMSRPAVQAPATCSQSRPPHLSPTGCPNYISQDEDDDLPTMRRTTRSTSNIIMQEAMLSCNDIQAKVCPVSRLGNPELCRNSAYGNNVHGDTPTDVCTQDPHDLVL